MNRKNHKYKTNFLTLIELIAVIAVIGVLAAILIPVLSKSKAKSRQLQCVSNIAQLCKANMLYALDNGGVFVPAATDILEDKAKYWYGNTEHNDIEPASLMPYLKTEVSEMGCPETKSFDFTKTENVHSKSGGYALNMLLGISRNIVDGGGVNTSAMLDPTLFRSGISQAIVMNPSKKVMFSDSADFVDNNLQLQPVLNPPVMNDIFMKMNTHFRHSKSANVGFADGHVAGMPIKFTEDTHSPEIVLGSPWDNSMMALKMHYAP